MLWPIVDARGFQDLRIGDARSTVRERFGTYQTARRVRDDTVEYDFFVESGVMAYFDETELVVFIEVASPADPGIQGVGLLDRDLVSLVKDLELVGLTYRHDFFPRVEKVAASSRSPLGCGSRMRRWKPFWLGTSSGPRVIQVEVLVRDQEITRRVWRLSTTKPGGRASSAVPAG